MTVVLQQMNDAREMLAASVAKEESVDMLTSFLLSPPFESMLVFDYPLPH